jgi:glycine dehydrogenase subunit 1
MRYLPLTKQDREEMLSAIGVKNVNELYSAIPAGIMKKSEKVNLPPHAGELEVERHLKNYAEKNTSASKTAFFLGCGCYNHHIPSTVDYIIQRSEFLTSYTPYQPEIAQGNLNVIFEFQTYIARLTGMDVANASMYDGATAAGEAALMAMRLKPGRGKIRIASCVNPQYKEVVRTNVRYHEEMEVIEDNEDPCEQTACVIVQTPNFYGTIMRLDAIREKCNKVGALMVVVINEILSLGLLQPPSMADIVCGEAQSIGVNMSYGGPHLGFFACKKEYVRQMPGRLCGMTQDEEGRRSFVLTLSTREQHIRREKATSNICSNQGLMALAFTVHLSLLGEIGFKQLAKINHQKAAQLAEKLSVIKGVKLLNKTFFNEFTIEVPGDSKALVEKLTAKNIIAGYAVDKNKIIIAVTEVNTDEQMEKLVAGLESSLRGGKADEAISD